MAIRTLTRNVPALTLRADVGTVDAEKRTVEMTWSTGARVYRPSWFDAGSFEELGMAPENVRMERLQSGNAPFLADHYGSTSNVLGVIESARLDGGKGIAKVRFPSPGVDERADQVFEKIRQGILKNVSVGYRTHRAAKVGKAARGDDEIPVYRAVDWEPHEISAVAIGADAAATFRSAEQFNPCVFETREEETSTVDEEQKKREAEELAKRQRAEAEAKSAEEMKKREADATERATKAERERASAIQGACRAAKMPTEFGAKLVADGVQIDKAREMILEELAKRSDETAIDPHHTGGIKVGEEDREKWARGAEAGQLHRSGAIHVLAAAIASTKRKSEALGERGVAPGLPVVFETVSVKDNGGEFRAMSLVDLARDFLQRHNVKTRGMDADQVLKRAMNYRDSGSEQTTSDFGTVLENLMYKTLLGFYAQADDTWRRWAGVDSVADFRPANRYRLGSFGILDLMGENDEYKHKKIPDGFKQQISVLTYGNKIALSRRAIINDDMGAVMTMAQQFGRAAGLSLEVAAYDATAGLLANAGLGPTVTYNGSTLALMDAGFSNISTGAALSVAALEADRVQMAKQKDPSSNEFLAMRPSVLLLPVGLEGEAKVINRSTTDPTITAGNPTNRPNISAGLFTDIVGTARLTGTRRYLFSRDQGVDSFKMVFLNGAQVPMMEQRPGWDVDGIEWKLRHDFNFLPFDPMGVVTNAGA